MNLSVVFLFGNVIDLHWYQIEDKVQNRVATLSHLLHNVCVDTSRGNIFIFVHKPQECLYLRKLCFKIFHVSLGTTTSCICPRKVKDLHFRCHLMWSRWFNFLILLQCSICSLYRKKKKIKKVTSYLLLPTYSNFFSPKHTYTHTQYISIYIYIYI